MALKRFGLVIPVVNVLLALQSFMNGSSTARGCLACVVNGLRCRCRLHAVRQFKREDIVTSLS